MMDNIFNLMFRCSHRRLSRPLSGRKGEPSTGTYVVCFDCGKHFAYDWKAMHVGHALETGTPAHAKSRLQYALWSLALPFAWVAGMIFRSKDPGKKR